MRVGDGFPHTTFGGKRDRQACTANFYHAAMSGSTIQSLSLPFGISEKLVIFRSRRRVTPNLNKGALRYCAFWHAFLLAF